MDKKYGILIICTVILFLGFIGTASAKTWHVDDDLQDHPYADFTRIQDAVNIAASGDTIIVYNGTYYENVVVNKQLNITGLGMPIVNASGEGDVITLLADGCILEGFKVTGSGELRDIITDSYDSGIEIRSDNNLVRGNYVVNNRHNIFLWHSKNNTITNNNCSNTPFGVYIVESTKNKITNNILLKNRWAIKLWESNNNTLSDNVISNATVSHIGFDAICGIELIDSANNSITNNTISHYLLDHIILDNSSNNTVFGNTLCEGSSVQQNVGISVKYNANDNLIIYNNISNLGGGIGVSRSNKNLIVKNIIYSSKYSGVLLSNSNYNQIYHNNFLNNTGQAYDSNVTNIWDNGYPSGGNYWSDYSGEDKYNGPLQDQPGSDGIGDTPYPIQEAARDKYPHMNENGWLLPKENIFDTGSPQNPYPSISGMHNGTITPSCNISVSKLYTYPCAGTGGHTEYARIWNSSWDGAEAHWNGYKGDWHNISFNKTFTLLAGKTYNYTIRTGSYPQIIHESPFDATGGTITCDKFIDANGRIYYDWIPAIKLG